MPGLTASDIMQGKLGVKIYFIEIKMDFPSFSKTLIERIPIYAKKIDGKVQFLDIQAIDIINQIITCAFLHELIVRTSLFEYYRQDYPREKAKFLIIYLLKHDKQLGQVYKNFLKKIEDQRRFEEDMIKEIKKSFRN